MDCTVEKAIRAAVAQSPRSMLAAARIANIPYPSFVRYAKELGIYQPRKYGFDSETEKCVREAIAQSPLSMSEAARIADIPLVSFKRYAQQLKLYQPNQPGRGLRKYGRKSPRTIPLEEILAGKHPHYSAVHLKRRLIAAGIKENRCEAPGCGLGPEWNGKPLTLTLEHMDGDNTNHRLENLRIYCPNCHSQTETFCGSKAAKGCEEAGDLQSAVTGSKVASASQSAAVPERAKRTSKYGNPDDYHRARHEQYVLDQQPYVEKVLASGIDFTKFGWVSAVASIIGQKPQKVHQWMKSVMPVFYAEKCFKRKPPSDS